MQRPGRHKDKQKQIQTAMKNKIKFGALKISMLGDKLRQKEDPAKQNNNMKLKLGDCLRCLMNVLKNKNKFSH